jgi:phenylpyruvate tautomerase PptA (4-oxalocrotonate tautomerase family)
MVILDFQNKNIYKTDVYIQYFQQYMYDTIGSSLTKIAEYSRTMIRKSH